MSTLDRNREKINEKFEKNSTLFYGDLIEYSEAELTEVMKKGYMEMGEINLQLAIDSESELVDVNKYETWLCGV
ncbi:MAG: hypothetical protein PUE01_01640 [Clostridiaceae bacterium]|nr:hypothetical protein [Clostridiaceae bacterium]